MKILVSLTLPSLAAREGRLTGFVSHAHASCVLNEYFLALLRERIEVTVSILS